MWGTSDASGIGFQLSMYRLIDSWEEARRIKEDGRNAYNLTAMTINYDNLAGRYNDLVVSFNTLLDTSQQADRMLASRDQEIADLRQKLAESQARSAYLQDAWSTTIDLKKRYMGRALDAEAELRTLRSRQP